MVPLAAIQAVPIAVIAWYRLHRYAWYRYSAIVTERIEQKIFHAEIVVDTDKVKREESHYQPIPIINDFKDTDGNDCMKQAIQDNYNQIKEDVKLIVKDELDRIAADENLKHLIQK